MVTPLRMWNLSSALGPIIIGWSNPTESDPGSGGKPQQSVSLWEAPTITTLINTMTKSVSQTRKNQFVLVLWDAAEGDDKVAAEQSFSRKKTNKKKPQLKNLIRALNELVTGILIRRSPPPGGVRICNKADRNSAPLPLGIWNRERPERTN